MNVSFQVYEKQVLIDEDDILLVAEYSWHLIRRRGRQAYVGAMLYHGASPIYLHRLVMNAPPGVEVDHINGDGCDNRKANLRLCTSQENRWNIPQRRTNRSGFMGVSWHKRERAWRAQYSHRGKLTFLGYFDTPEAAHAAYVAAVAPLRGQFCKTS